MDYSLAYYNSICSIIDCHLRTDYYFNGGIYDTIRFDCILKYIHVSSRDGKDVVEYNLCYTYDGEDERGRRNTHSDNISLFSGYTQLETTHHNMVDGIYNSMIRDKKIDGILK